MRATGPDEARAWPGLPELQPASVVPRWRGWVAWLLVAVPVLVCIVADTTASVRGEVAPNALSPWTGLALCAAWVPLLARTVLPLARLAPWIEATCAALAVVAMVQRIGVAFAWLLAGLGAVLVGAIVLALHRHPARTARIPAPAAAARPAHPATGDLAFTETSSDPARAALVVVGCAVFAAIGAWQVVSIGAFGWWYVVAAVVWLTGSVPWMLRVTLDRSGLVVRSLVLPFALLRVPLASIADASAGIVHPRRWGGTGLVADERLTTILRAEGAALVVTRTDGTQVVVNVERPDVAVATLDALRAADV